MKVFGGVLIALMLVFNVSAATTFDTSWYGSGGIDIDFIADDDARSSFLTEGSLILGEFHAKDFDDNPYGYGIDTVETKTKANVFNGYIEYLYNRNDSKESMYGHAGQTSYTFINSSGSGQFAWRTMSNYAKIGNSNYGWQNDNQITADGEHEIYHSLDNAYNEGASIHVLANGTTKITSMCEDTWGSSFMFGKGCGCYTNAKVDIDGTGEFKLTAIADNEIKTDSGITTDGVLSINAIFKNGFKYNNFALEGN